MGPERKTAVITGSTRGIGRALARALLDRGINVVLSSRQADEARAAAEELGRNAEARAIGLSCDVRRAEDVNALWAQACVQLGGVDIWVNNAGLALGGGLMDLTDEDVRTMLDINVMGVVHGCRTAVRGYAQAARPGAVYTMLGAGADGTLLPQMAGYAASKAAVTYLMNCLAEETRGSPVLTGSLSPGLVITEGFLRENAKAGGMNAQRRAHVNLIADHPRTVGNWAARILDTNTEHGRTFAWLTPRKIRERARRPARDILSAYPQLA
ncbi:SDR family oxidoreductase [Novosphingobium profundi]|uniref:SDR family oxidoreductase n=1 Tax=Novosphingobium profundi TaxID=1774954 RepID=UPI001BD96F7D|nr:SDR family oxidoreductase [Novosphingobium profundi]MBT0668223.1 SDR family oxidoreductase [Novosphingobium profundi]